MATRCWSLSCLLGWCLYSDPSQMVSYLLPLLEKYNVHAYICGHDHISMHMQYKGYSTEFSVAGAGSMTDSLYYKSKASSVWSGPNYAAFSYMDASSKYLEFGIVDTNDEVKYRYKLTNLFALKLPPSSRPTSRPTAGPSNLPTLSLPSWSSTVPVEEEGLVPDNTQDHSICFRDIDKPQWFSRIDLR